MTTKHQDEIVAELVAKVEALQYIETRVAALETTELRRLAQPAPMTLPAPSAPLSVMCLGDCDGASSRVDEDGLCITCGGTVVCVRNDAVDGIRHLLDVKAAAINAVDGPPEGMLQRLVALGEVLDAD